MTRKKRLLSELLNYSVPSAPPKVFHREDVPTKLFANLLAYSLV